MVTFASTILRVKPSPTLDLQAAAVRLRAEGRDIIGLVAGEPDFDTPEHVKAGAREALKNNYTRYTDVEGIKKLREVICNKLKRDQDINYDINQIVVTNGGKQALATALSVLINPGDEVIIPSPYWTSYPDMVELCAGKSVFVTTKAEDGYLMSAEALSAACTDKTKVIIINSPSNPTGACYNKEQFLELISVIKSLKNINDIIIILDEVYEYITFDNFSHVSFATLAPELKDNILVVNAFSKSYAMTGWRVGYVAASVEIARRIKIHQSQFTSNVCSIAQHAAADAYNDDYAFPKMLAREFGKRRDLVCSAISNMKDVNLPVTPLGAFYVFPQVNELFGKKAGNFIIDSSESFVRYLLEAYNVMIVHGDAFGDAFGFRLSFAIDEKNLTQALERIAEAVNKLS
jgi:aspartate aminotransferase